MRMRLSVIPITFAAILFFLAASSSGDQEAALQKIESSLRHFMGLSSQDVEKFARLRGLRYDRFQDSVSVVVEPAWGISTSRLASGLARQGAEVRAESSRFVRAGLPIDQLEAIAALPEIEYIRSPLKYWELQRGSFNPGVLQTGGHLLHAYDIRGEGVTIAVIDAGFEGLAEALNDRIIDRKAIRETFDYTEEGLEDETDHGYLVARIAHEMAPDASLLLMKVADEVDLENAVRDAIRYGARIISHSLGWFDSNFGDGRGVIDDIARMAEKAGVLWVNAAGNHALSHWMGTNQVVGNHRWVEFEPGLETLEIWMSFPGNIDLVLVWDDWPLSYQDYDFYLTDWQEEIIASSEERQMGRAGPRESISHFVERPGVYKVKVKAHRATKPMRLKIYSMEQELTPSVAEGSVMAPADCRCTLAVGAIGFRQWEEGISEPFSAQGPTGDGRIKPDLMGPDGARGFYGTSAAAPHVAGAAALLLSRNPQWGVIDLREALLDQTADIYAPGKDIMSGSGKLSLQLSSPTTSRSLSSETATPGTYIDVTLDLRVPASQFGRFEVIERVPARFPVEIRDRYEAQIYDVRNTGRQEIKWQVGPLGPGDSIQLRYRIEIPTDTRPEQFSIEGVVNEQPIEGAERFSVRAGIQISSFDGGQPLLRPHVSSRYVKFILKREAIENTESVRFEVFNLEGKLIFDSGFVPPKSMTLASNRDWPSGVYISRLTLLGNQGKELRHQLQKFHVLK